MNTQKQIEELLTGIVCERGISNMILDYSKTVNRKDLCSWMDFDRLKMYAGYLDIKYYPSTTKAQLYDRLYYSSKIQN